MSEPAAVLIGGGTDPAHINVVLGHWSGRADDVIPAIADVLAARAVPCNQFCQAR